MYYSVYIFYSDFDFKYHRLILTDHVLHTCDGLSINTTCPGMLVNLTAIIYISSFAGWLMCDFGIVLTNIQLRISCIRVNLLVMLALSPHL